MLLANVDRRQLGLWHGCGVIHQHHYRINVDVVVILWWCGWSPKLWWKTTYQKPSKGKIGFHVVAQYKYIERGRDTGVYIIQESV